MRKSWIFGWYGAALVAAALVPACLLAFQPGGFQPGGPGRRPPGMNGPGGQGQPRPERRDEREERESKEREELARIVTGDPKLLTLHKEFVAKAEKMMLEYDRAKQYDKVRVLARQMLNLVPGHPPATEMLKKLGEMEANAETAVVDVMADRNWQDTGIMVQEGKPLAIRATGTWTLKMEHELTPDGMEIPKEWRDAKLGALVGTIYTGDMNDLKPFTIGSEYNGSGDRTGKLFVRMFAPENKSCSGKLKLEVRGTFTKSAKTSSP